MASEASGSGTHEDLEAMMKELGLSKEDLDDVVVEKNSTAKSYEMDGNC